MRNLNRRKFLGGVAALAASSITARAACAQANVPTADEQLGREDAAAPAMSDGKPALRTLFAEADGAPIAAERMRTLHARDLRNDPLPQAIAMADGRARLELADEPMQVVMRLRVPAFGEVYCFADNGGRGYSRAENRDFIIDAAQTRARRVREAWEKLRPSGLEMGRQFHERLAAASRAIPGGEAPARLAAAYEALAHGLHAGEQLALAKARHQISRLPKPRDDFKFGVMISGFNRLGPEYERRVRELFDFATVSWYTWKDQASAAAGDPIDYSRMDASVEWALARGLTPKNFGYLYMARGATPEWIRPIERPAGDGDSSAPRRAFNERWPYEHVKQTYEQVIRQTMQRYHGRVPYAEIMNEAHDKANLWGLSHEQILDWAQMAFRAAREGSPTVQRMMNHCCMWGEYAKNRNPDGSRRWSPHQFVRACFDHAIDYEVIGVQLYYPQHDLFEIDRMLDRFTEFGKPIHITEIATASEDQLDARSMRPNTYSPGWHGPWTESTQADWAEAVYTLCYSKPQFQVAGWWDLADVPGHFWPFGGLLRENLQPKEAYHRLSMLKEQWGLTKS